MASRAFTARFMTICSTCPRSAFTGASSGRRLSTTFTSSPMRRPSIARMSATTTFRSSSVGSMISLRLNASSWRVSPAARSPAFLNLRDVRLARIVRIEIRQQQLAVAQNHGQQIVEVVRHAAGQPSDRLHLLGLLDTAPPACGVR